MNSPQNPSESATAEMTPPEGGARLFGRYRVRRELGRGGMGVVLLADDEVLGVPMALKLMPEAVARDAEASNELKKEVLRGMALTHPGIVRVFSFERDATTAAIVMEFVEGGTLGELKAQQPGGCCDAEQIRPWIEQLCAVLAYAHGEAKIAHRDLKPRNLMLTPAGRLKVADFGIASGLSDSLSRISVRAGTSGTPAYMSPQQAMGTRPSHLDDLYSLGATIYDLLTGKPPFFRGQILAQVLDAVPPLMRQRREEFDVSGKAPIPETWEKVVAACLAKEPEDRPQSANAVLAHLHEERAAPEVIVPKVEIREPHPPVPEPRVIREFISVPVPAPVIRRVVVVKWPDLPAWLWPFAVVLILAAATAGGVHLARKYWPQIGATFARTPDRESAVQPTPAPATPNIRAVPTPWPSALGTHRLDGRSLGTPKPPPR